MDTKQFLQSQLCVTLPVPSKRFTGQTIIVTGSNVGIGLETARYFVSLDAAKVILAVRDVRKGERAAKSIVESTGRTGIVEVWELDLSIYNSVKSFIERSQSLKRLDILVNNAGILVYKFQLAEDNESTITVNAISGMLLSISLLPKLRETSVQFGKENLLIFTGSFVHFMTDFPEQKAQNILEELASEDRVDMKNRYFVSKLVQLLMVRELANQISSSNLPGNITVSIVNPGFVKTEVMRNASVLFHLVFRPWRKLVARSTEEGARTILHAASSGKETHGQYLSDCKVAMTSDFVRSAQGEDVQKRLWAELSSKLEDVSPGIMKNL